MSDSFHEITGRYLKRREFLAAGVALAGTALMGCSSRNTLPNQARNKRPGFEGPHFNSLGHSLHSYHSVSEGYQSDVLIRWGDSLSGEPPSGFPLSANDQRSRFGYNNDFIAYMPLSRTAANGTEHVRSAASDRGLLCINHEYALPHLMFPGYESYVDVVSHIKDEQVTSAIYSVGHSVIEVEKKNGDWHVVNNSVYQRRITPYTPIEITGPAAGTERLKTRDDKTGRLVLGTLGNCAGGKTPWGTVLIAEENFSFFFDLNASKISKVSARELENHRDFDVDKYQSYCSKVDPRFELTHEENEMNRFGWVVEYDPYDATSVPKKRTALGRFAHEAATVVCKDGYAVVAYSGDDDENEFLYRFVSAGIYQNGQHANNQNLLEEGTLYCAQFNDDGTGKWLPLIFGQGPLTSNNGFYNQADVLIEARRAAKLLDATAMDRPEDIDTNPVTDRTYVALTKNKQKLSVNSANPKASNPTGHIVEILAPGVDGNRDHTQTDFTWDIFIVAGDEKPNAQAENAGQYGKGIQPSGWFTNPDNIAFDIKGRLWISTDGCPDFGFADGMWCTATEGEDRAKPRHFFGCPKAAEMCGPEFTPDGKTLFLAVQHPADEEGSHYANPSTRWPDFDEALPPRPSIVVVTKKDQGLIGD